MPMFLYPLRLGESLNQIDWSILDSIVDTDILATFLVNTYNSLIEPSFLSKKLYDGKHSSHKVLFDDSLKSTRDTLSSVELVADVSNDPISITAYKTLIKVIMPPQKMLNKKLLIST